MPVCRRCEVAYLEGEVHTCDPKSDGSVSMGAVVGAVALSGATSVFHATFHPSAWRDGHVFIYFFTVPVGVALGLIAALAWREWAAGDRRSAGRTAAAGGIAGIILSAITRLEVGLVFSVILLAVGVIAWKGVPTKV